MIKVKPGVKFTALSPQMALAISVAESVFKMYGVDTVVTSANDSKHGANSLHYSGKAVDLRTRDFPKDKAKAAHEALKTALGSEFDVILETDHIHVEFDPK